MHAEPPPIVRTLDHSGKVGAYGPAAHHRITQGDEIVQPYIGCEPNEERSNAEHGEMTEPIYIIQP